MGDDADGHELFTVVATVHHQRICEALDDGTLGFSEALGGITACGVGDVDGGTDLDVVTTRGQLVLADMLWCLSSSL